MITIIKINTNMRTINDYKDNILISQRSPRFFEFYAFLAFERKRNLQCQNGFVSCDVIQLLPAWRDLSVEKIGNRISDHINDMENKNSNIIEAQRKARGPFRLKVLPNNIKFDIDLNEVEKKIGLPFNHKDEIIIKKDLWKYAYFSSLGKIYFEEGNFDEALNCYNFALIHAFNFNLRAAIQLQVGRILERRGKYLEARKIYNEVLKFFGNNPNFFKARACIFIGWSFFRQRRFKEVNYYYKKCLKSFPKIGYEDCYTLGHYYNGIGKLLKANKKCVQAMEQYFKALYYWSLDFYIPEILHCMFNIVNLYEYNNPIIAKIYSDICVDEELKDRTPAEFLLEEHINKLEDRSGMAYSDCQNRILMSIFRENVGDFDKAIELAQNAKKEADTTKNINDQAGAYKQLGKLYLQQYLNKNNHKSLQLAKSYLETSKNFYCQIDNFENVREIREMLSNLKP